MVEYNVLWNDGTKNGEFQDVNPREARKLFDHISPRFTRISSVHFPPVVDGKSMDWHKFSSMYEECQRQMDENHLWFEDALNYNFRKATHKSIALGRAPFYIQFVDFYYERYGQRLYLLDLMLRKDGLDGLQSLLYFIEDAEQIHVNLEGVLPNELEFATVGIGRISYDKSELFAPYTTAWEINQIFYKGLLPMTTFHTGSAMSRNVAWRAMGKAVPFSRILDDNKNLLDDWVTESGAKRVEDLEEL